MRTQFWKIPLCLLFGAFASVAVAQETATPLPTEVSVPATEVDGWGDATDSTDSTEVDGWGDATDSTEVDGWGDVTDPVTNSNRVDSEVPNLPETSTSSTKLNLPFHGFLRSILARHLNNNSAPKNISAAQVALQIEYDQRFFKKYRFHLVSQVFHDFVYSLEGRSLYSASELATFEDGAEVKEAWVNYRGDSFDLSIGRQIVVWGEADGLAVTDLINPRDQSQLFFRSLEDSRLSVGMGQLNYYWGENTLSFITIGEFRPNRQPPKGSEFDFGPAIQSNFKSFPFEVTLGKELLPNTNSNSTTPMDPNQMYALQSPEWGVRLMLPRSGYDLSFMAASLFDYNSVFQVGNLVFTDKGLQSMTLDLAHKRFSLLGATLNKLAGSFVFKAEVASYKDKSYNTLKQSLFAQTDAKTGIPLFLTNQNLAETLFLIEKKNVVNTAIGFDYTYSDQLSILFQQQYQKILDFKEGLLASEESFISFANFAFSFMNDQLKPNYAVFYIGGDDDYLHKAKIAYETTMGLNVSLGVDVIAPSDRKSRIGQFYNASRLWGQMKYSF